MEIENIGAFALALLIIGMLLIDYANAETISSASYKTTVNIVSGNDLISSTSYKSNPKIVPIGGLMSSDSYKTAINELSVPQAEYADTGSGGGSQGGNSGCPIGFKRVGMNCTEMTPAEYVVDTVESIKPKAKPITAFVLIFASVVGLLFWFNSDEEKKKKIKEKVKLHKKENRDELKKEIKERIK